MNRTLKASGLAVLAASLLGTCLYLPLVQYLISLSLSLSPTCANSVSFCHVMFSFNRCLSAGIVCTGLYASQTNQQPEMANKLAAVKAINAEISLASKRCVVVGGTSGIGHGVALRLARAGCSVTIVGRKERGIVEEMKAISPDGVECSHSFMYVASSTL